MQKEIESDPTYFMASSYTRLECELRLGAHTLPKQK